MRVVASDATVAPTNQEALPPRRRMKSIALITRRINPITANDVPNPMSRCHAIHPAPMTRKRTPIESSRLAIDLTLGVWQIPPASRNPDGYATDLMQHDPTIDRADAVSHAEPSAGRLRLKAYPATR